MPLRVERHGNAPWLRGKEHSTPATTTDYLQRRASYQTRKGRCSTLNCCMSLSLNRGRLKETCSSCSFRQSFDASGRRADVAFDLLGYALLLVVHKMDQ
ncbi:hypothetical protein NXT3_CH00602 [Sinorhizobium fredii]|uniref:Uncharacterized protein n=1 Tax=Rhizobium fredii TaxID=380 RepID=A0A2L0H147_RHIFR|nr:hypothetical protein NXT3_CH00602 [Sinorhizobium fredii]